MRAKPDLITDWKTPFRPAFEAPIFFHLAPLRKLIDTLPEVLSGVLPQIEIPFLFPKATNGNLKALRFALGRSCLMVSPRKYSPESIVWL